jgi:hypothetical protein
MALMEEEQLVESDMEKPAKGKKESVDNETVLKRMAEIKAMIEKNNEMAKVVETEPRKVLSKLYIEGTPSGLKNIVSSIIGGYGIDVKGNPVLDKRIAVTLMIEDLVPKK